MFLEAEITIDKASIMSLTVINELVSLTVSSSTSFLIDSFSLVFPLAASVAAPLDSVLTGCCVTLSLIF